MRSDRAAFWEAEIFEISGKANAPKQRKIGKIWRRLCPILSSFESSASADMQLVDLLGVVVGEPDDLVALDVVLQAVQKRRFVI